MQVKNVVVAEERLGRFPRKSVCVCMALCALRMFSLSPRWCGSVVKACPVA